MSIWKRLFHETCPHCDKKLDTSESDVRKAIVIKACPDHHYKKEIYPLLETHIETHHYK